MKKVFLRGETKTHGYNDFFFVVAPEESPEELQCSAVSSSSMRVSWRPLPLHLQGGAMIGYTLLYSTTGK